VLLAAAVLLAQACVPPVPATPDLVTPSITLTPSPSPTATPTPSPTTTPTPTPTHTPTPDHPSAARVLVISIDGLRPDAVTPGSAPNLSELAARGAASWSARTVYPSRTLPGHASMLTGYDVDGHGVDWNGYQPENGYVRSPTLFSLAKADGFRAVMIVSKYFLIHIAAPGTVDLFTVVEDGDPAAARAALPQMYFGFGVLFVHLLEPDTDGHQFGWMSSEYLEAVRDADEQVGILVDELEARGLAETTLLILTSDHSGQEFGHGSEDAQESTIPWIIVGPGVAGGRTLTSPIYVYDTTATALWALGVPLPDDMDGRPVREAFTQFSN
jgi:arylsulfatase A-like enzyme